jgi:predicted DNA-binding protein YlxM (UPF0122 family)
MTPEEIRGVLDTFNPECLTPRQENVMRRYSEGESVSNLASEHKVSRSRIYQLIHNGCVKLHRDYCKNNPFSSLP